MTLSEGDEGREEEDNVKRKEEKDKNVSGEKKIE